MVDSSELPPNDKNGNVSPVSGIVAVTPPTLMIACTHSHAVDATGDQHAEAIGRRQRDLDAEEREQQEGPQHCDHPDQTELLGDDGEDEVGVGQRQVAPLGPAGADPDPGEPTVGDADHALQDLVPLVVAMLDDIEERGPPVAPVLGAEYESERDEPHHAADTGERGERGAGDEGHGQHDRAQHDGRAEVTLGHEERPRDSEDDQARPQGRFHDVHRVGSLGQQVGAVEQHGDLEELRRLEADRAHLGPGPSAVDRHSDARDERQGHHHEGTHQDRQHPAAPPLVRHAHRDHEGERSESGPEGLPGEVAPRRPPGLERGDRRRRQHHHQPEQRQHHHDGGDDVVRDGRVLGAAGDRGGAALAAASPGRVALLQPTLVVHHRRRAAHESSFVLRSLAASAVGADGSGLGRPRRGLGSSRTRRAKSSPRSG